MWHPSIEKRIYKTRVFRWWLRVTGRGPEFVPKMLSDDALRALDSEINLLKNQHRVEVRPLQAGETPGKPVSATGVEPAMPEKATDTRSED